MSETRDQSVIGRASEWLGSGMLAAPIVLGVVAAREAYAARERIAGNLASQLGRLREVVEGSSSDSSITELDTLAAALLPAVLIENNQAAEGVVPHRVASSSADTLRARLTDPKGIK